MNDELAVELSLLPATPNGGYPEPPATVPIKVVVALHHACGEETRVRLPEILPTRAIRTLHCSHCDQDFSAETVEDLTQAATAVAPEAAAVAPEAPAPEFAAASPAALEEFKLPEFELPDFGSLTLTAEAPAVAEPEPVVIAVEETEELVEGVVLQVPEVELPDLDEEPASNATIAVEVVEPKPQPLPEPIPAAFVPEPPPVLARARVVEVAPEPVAAPTRRAKPKLPQVNLPQVKLPKLEVKRPKLPELPRPRVNLDSPAARLAGYAVAAVAFVALLGVIQGDGEPIAASVPPPAAAAQAPATSELASDDTEGRNVYDLSEGPPAAAEDAATEKPNKDTSLVRGSTYSFALPAGWQRVDSEGGAAFAAVSSDADADVQLWISEDPKLEFPDFINLSLQQLQTLAGSAEVVERVPGPTPETTVVRLAAEAPEGEPTYEVTLRAAGPYRYYLATTVQPGASAKALEDVELITGSFTPEAGE